MDYFGADPDHWNFDGGDEPPAEGQADRHAAKVLGELEKALFALADEWNLDTPVPENPAAEAARLRVMALLSAIMPIPTRDEWARRAEAEREAEVAKKKAAAAARQKERRAIKKGGRPSEDTRHEQFRLEPRATPEDAPAVQAGPVIRPGTS